MSTLSIVLGCLLALAVVAIVILYINAKDNAFDCKYWRDKHQSLDKEVFAAHVALNSPNGHGTQLEQAILRKMEVLNQIEGVVNVPALDKAKSVVDKVRLSVSFNNQAAKAGFIPNK